MKPKGYLSLPDPELRSGGPCATCFSEEEAVYFTGTNFSLSGTASACSTHPGFLASTVIDGVTSTSTWWNNVANASATDVE